MNSVRVIKEASKVVLSICGVMPKADINNWRYSEFILRHPVTDGELLYSFLTGELILVRSFSDSFVYLVNNRFVVPKKYDERQNVHKYQKIISSIRKIQKPMLNTFEIVTTTSCNADCFYCYERGFQKASMKKETAQASAEFIAKHSGPIKLIWFGGEPLVNLMPIKVISEILMGKNVDFSASLTTNGLQITDSLIDKMIKWRINHITVTLDGTEERYNQIKNYKTRIKNPYKTVLDNLVKIVQAGIKLSIRINIEKHNIEDAVILAGYLRELFHETDLVSFMFRTLNNTRQDSTIESSDRKRIFHVVESEMDKMFSAGFNVAVPLMSGVAGHCCKADSGQFILIRPDGKMAFCSEDFDSICAGSVYDDPNTIVIPSLSDRLFEKIGEICGTCPKYPNCMPTMCCPAHKSTICTREERDLIIHETILSMLQEYKKFNEKDYENQRNIR